MGNRQSPALNAELIEANKTRIEPLLHAEVSVPLDFITASYRGILTIDVHYVCLIKMNSHLLNLPRFH